MLAKASALIVALLITCLSIYVILNLSAFRYYIYPCNGLVFHIVGNDDIDCVISGYESSKVKDGDGIRINKLPYGEYDMRVLKNGIGSYSIHFMKNNRDYI